MLPRTGDLQTGHAQLHLVSHLVAHSTWKMCRQASRTTQESASTSSRQMPQTCASPSLQQSLAFTNGSWTTLTNSPFEDNLFFCGVLVDAMMFSVLAVLSSCLMSVGSLWPLTDSMRTPGWKVKLDAVARISFQSRARPARTALTTRPCASRSTSMPRSLRHRLRERCAEISGTSAVAGERTKTMSRLCVLFVSCNSVRMSD
mmetsp:Transcript_53606/g.141283  ORF Transcript_53606/g.141283 Transcript_53606/m.141283 type:complete len:202 (+) Transcript_53606:342-947(+)